MRSILPVLVLFITSCNHDDPNDSIIKEKVLDLTNEYNKVWETLDVEKIAAFHSNESFVYYWHGDLASSSNDHFRKLFPDILSTIKGWSIKKTSPPLVQVLNKQSAIVSFTLEAEVIGLDGSRSNEAGALSYIWKKINDQWKIVHIHDSPK